MARKRRRRIVFDTNDQRQGRVHCHAESRRLSCQQLSRHSDPFAGAVSGADALRSLSSRPSRGGSPFAEYADARTRPELQAESVGVTIWPFGGGNKPLRPRIEALVAFREAASYPSEFLPEIPLDAIRSSVRGGNPYGNALWNEQMIELMGLEATVRPRGRPKKQRKRS